MSEIPNHIAFIMDGNGRWAIKRGLPRSEGHKAGYEHISEVLEVCADLGVNIVSCYAWSTENWSRPVGEVNFILGALEEQLPRFVDELDERGVRFIHSGSLERLPEQAKEILRQSEERTQDNGPRIFNLVFNYGGRLDIVQAARKLLNADVHPSAVTKEALGLKLYTKGLPDIDLVIRLGGDKRLSNFLLWQAAYARVYIVDSYWPEISRDDIERGVEYYRSVLGSV